MSHMLKKPKPPEPADFDKAIQQNPFLVEAGSEAARTGRAIDPLREIATGRTDPGRLRRRGGAATPSAGAQAPGESINIPIVSAAAEGAQAQLGSSLRLDAGTAAMTPQQEFEFKMANDPEFRKQHSGETAPLDASDIMDLAVPAGLVRKAGTNVIRKIGAQAAANTRNEFIRFIAEMEKRGRIALTSGRPLTENVLKAAKGMKLDAKGVARPYTPNTKVDTLQKSFLIRAASRFKNPWVVAGMAIGVIGAAGFTIQFGPNIQEDNLIGLEQIRERAWKAGNLETADEANELMEEVEELRSWIPFIGLGKQFLKGIEKSALSRKEFEERKNMKDELTSESEQFNLDRIETQELINKMKLDLQDELNNMKKEFDKEQNRTFRKNREENQRDILEHQKQINELNLEFERIQDEMKRAQQEQFRRNLELQIEYLRLKLENQRKLNKIFEESRPSRLKFGLL